MGRYLQAHPEGPYSYGLVGLGPGRPAARPTHERWLKQYLPLVEEGRGLWMEIGDGDLFTKPLAEGVVSSAFANRELYLALANYGQNRVDVQTANAYVPLADPQSAPQPALAA